MLFIQDKVRLPKNLDINVCHLLLIKLKKLLLMDGVFKQQIRRNIKVYEDDMVIKSQSIPQHVSDLKEVFGKLCKYDMRPKNALSG